MVTALALVSARGAFAQDGYRVVVNPNNPVSSLSRTQVSKLFLDKGTWDKRFSSVTTTSSTRRV